jgi:hypothetical protein
MEGTAWIPYSQLIWLIAVDYETTRQEFTYLAEGAISTGLALPQHVHMPLAKSQPWIMRAINGCIVETRTLADFRKALTAKPPDLIIICEPGLIANLNDVMELLSGRVAEKRGCVIAAGTSDEASEEWYELWEGWNRPNPEGGRAFAVPTWDNHYRFPAGRKEDEFRVYETKYGHEALMAHYGGVPAAPADLVLKGSWNYETHVRPDIKFDPGKAVEIAIDPGYSGGSQYVVEVVQWSYESPDIYLVDEIAVEGMTHDEVRALCEAKKWWPHVSAGTIDGYAGESHIYGNIAPATYWDPPINLRTDIRPAVNTTVQALKEALSGRLHVSSRCERFAYEAPRWRQKTGKPSPQNCDALKAAGYWLVDHFAQERVMGVHEDEDNVVTTQDWEYDI